MMNAGGILELVLFGIILLSLAWVNWVSNKIKVDRQNRRIYEDSLLECGYETKHIDEEV